MRSIRLDNPSAGADEAPQHRDGQQPSPRGPDCLLASETRRGMEIASLDVKRRFTETGGRLRWAVRSPWVRIPPLALSQPAVRAEGPRSRVSGHDELDPACRGAALLACLATRDWRLLPARGLVVRGKLVAHGPLGKNRRGRDGPSTRHGHDNSFIFQRTHGHTRRRVAGPAPDNRVASLAGGTA